MGAIGVWGSVLQKEPAGKLRARQPGESALLSRFSRVWLSWPQGLEPVRLLCPGAGCHFPPSGALPDTGLNLSLFHCLRRQVESLLLRRWGSPARAVPGAFMHSRTLSHSAASSSLRPHGLWPSRLLCPWASPGKNTGVGCPALLQGIFPAQGSNPGLPHCRWILYHLSYQGSPRILGWAAYPFPRGSSQTRNRTGVSWIAGGFFTSWATREAPIAFMHFIKWKAFHE